MPRRSEKHRSRPINPIDKEKYKGVQQLLDEESDTSFHSASTDAEATQYNLEYTNRTSRHQKQSKKESTARKPPATNLPRGRTSARISNSSRSRVSSSEPEEPDIIRTNPGTSPNRQSQQRKGLRTSASRGSNETNSPQRERQNRQPVAGSSKRKTTRPVRQEHQTTSRRDKVWNEIRVFQRTTGHLIPKLPFSRVIREIVMEESSSVTKITPAALMALQEAAETYLVHLFQDCYMCTLHRARVTLMIKDMELVRYLRGRLDPGNL